ncbi:MAG: VWA domain-containing protein [Candidatus Delongbacteria bacterium]|nr:VWA domain-containing protein [Candidatus Delongbacteria bacterium]MCG2759587.1 VWA domain-containing protein [Candidatus Delongbacteria bacterium]
MIFKFNDPQYLYLMFIPLIALIYHFAKKRRSYIRFSDSKTFEGVKKTLRIRFLEFPFILKIIAAVLVILALARPQSTSESSETITEGIDIVIATDISTSMLAQDFTPNRFEASLEVARDFINGRKNDRIGMVLFAGEAYTQCPLTTDYNILEDLTGNIKMGVIEDGTAIGSGIITAVNRLKNSKAKSKVIILLTDGENNRGEVSPETAADVATAMEIRIYTIGIGKNRAPYPFRGPFGQTIVREVEFKVDEEMLSNVAKVTGGKFYRATDKDKLKFIYEEIDKLEKTKIDIKSYKRFHEKYFLFLLPGLLIFLLALLLENTIFMKNP